MPTQAYALPYRLDGGACEVLLITSRRKGKWILPKGKMEPGETASERAAAEAYEEAGVRGTVQSTPLLAAEAADLSRPRIYPLKVDEELEQWPEMEQRLRAWFSLADARSLLGDDKLQRALNAFARELALY